MQIVPLRPLPNQTLQAQLGGQACTIDLQQTAYALFMTLYVGSDLVVASVICEDMNRIVRSEYLGFAGDFCFMDTQGDADPVYTGFGDLAARFQLLYLEEGEDLPEA